MKIQKKKLGGGGGGGSGRGGSGWGVRVDLNGEVVNTFVKIQKKNYYYFFFFGGGGVRGGVGLGGQGGWERRIEAFVKIQKTIFFGGGGGASGWGVGWM